MTQHTVLNATHRALGAKMVDFGGWDMPLNYGSQIEEHHAVRRDAGMFDVSHMTVVDLHGADTRAFLRRLLANNVDKLRVPGKALYSCMLTEQGGVIDDLIVYFLGEDFFRVVVNAATRDKDLPWIEQQAAAFGVKVTERRDLAMIAVQGPNARAKVQSLLTPATREKAAKIGKFVALEGDGLFIARTGYTGEDGYEIIVPESQAVDLWNQLIGAGVAPAGLGARDTLRLEAGMNLYGQDMDESVSPLECGLAWTVAWDPADRDFVGRKPLESQRPLPPRKQMGLVLEGRGVLRSHMQVKFANGAVGETTSGGFAPSMKNSIAFARVPANAEGAPEVEIRGQWLPARVVQPPFVRNGKVLV